MPKQLTREMIKDKTDRELLELKLLYIAETKEYTRKSYNNLSFFFWLTIAGFAIGLLIIFDNIK